MYTGPNALQGNTDTGDDGNVTSFTVTAVTLYILLHLMQMEKIVVLK
jgi:hypothetical protein